MKRLLFLLAMPVMLFLTSCATVNVPPVGGQWDTSRMEDWEISRIKEAEEELWKNARQAERKIDRSKLVYDDRQLEDYLNAVAQKLLPVEIRSIEKQPRIKVLKSPVANALALPNGAIYVHMGILTKMNNEAQVSFLLGHEIIHYWKRHALKEVRATEVNLATIQALQVVLISTGLGGLVLLPLLGQDELLALAATRGYSRDMETEADEGALKLMASAGYDPEEGVRFFQHLLDSGEEVKLESFYRNHPPLEQRIANLRKLLPQLNTKQRKGLINQEEYQTRIEPVLLENATLDMARGRFKLALSDIQKKLLLSPQDAKAVFLMGEWHRRSGLGNEEAEKKAIAAYRESVRLDPDYPDPHRELGLLFRARDLREEAITELERYLKLNREGADAPIIQGYLEDLRKTGKQ